MAKFSLKGFDFKAFFLDHGEKLAFGLFTLITLLVLARTSWSRYPKSPEQILDAVAKGRQLVQNSQWTDEKRQSFTLQDFMQQTHEVRGPLAVGRYEYSTPMWHPLYRKQELAKEPEWLAVTDLDARYGSFTLGVVPKISAPAGALAENSPTGNPAAAPAEDDEFAPRKTAAANPFGGAEASLDSAFNPLGGALGGAAANPFPAGDSLGDGMSGSAAPAMECRGERFIAVRGVFPLKQQLEKLQRALNLQSLAEARTFLELRDFVLERQTAVAGSDPWAGPWEAVDITRAHEVLEAAYNYDFDPVLPEIIDPVITMPLPGRLVGRWGEYATHPKIKNFELTGEEEKKVRALEEKLIEEFEKLRLEEESRQKQRGGFARVTRNLRSMAETIYSSQEASTDFESSFRNDTTFTTSIKMTPQEIRARLTSPADRVLLFRYFDFDVRPGYAYRYRVKLVVHNPNENRPAEQVVIPEVAQGETRETPWSKESNAAVVPESAYYFLRTVDRDTVNEPRAVKRPVANFSFFEWDATVGTMIADTVQVFSLGQFISERRKSLRLNVAVPTFKDEEVTFHSDDLLLDAEGDVRLPMEDHKDLKFPDRTKGAIGMMAAAVVVNRAGEVVALDPTPGTPTELALKSRVDRERAPYNDIKNKEEKAPGALDGAAAGLFGDTSADSVMMPASTKVKKKTSRKPMASSSVSTGP